MTVDSLLVNPHFLGCSSIRSVVRLSWVDAGTTTGSEERPSPD
jgi:hypothetical protein